ncbi:MAG: long-chain fatty acid--CoA ligase [Saprospiraceae bacterium]|nr:long-chain fatty acid--CoA ligase [Saprospiraceae bacterium]
MEKAEITRLFDFLTYERQHFPQENAFGIREGEKWIWWSSDDLDLYSRQLAAGLRQKGLQPGDKVVLVDYINRPEWVIADLACQLAGLVSVPVYPTISSHEYAYIFKDAGIKGVMLGGGDLYDKVIVAGEEVNISLLISFEPRPECIYWRELLEEDTTGIDAERDTIQADQLATIIYTSGTTGNPKGVMLDHASIVFNVKTILPMIPVSAGLRTLSFLPLCHIFERAVSYAYMYAGVSAAFTTPDRLGGDDGDLQAIRPHFFSTVPRLLEKVYEKIYNKGLALKGIKRGLFFWAMRLTEDYEYDKTYHGMARLKRWIADKLVFSKWREALGGEVRGIITGAAPCPTKMAQVFSAAGIPIREGYGMTEAAPGICITRFEPGMAKLGTVGPPIDGVEVQIDTDDPSYGPGEGEILSKGPNQMMGYYHKPDEDEKVFRWIDGERWLCTGDVGRWVEGDNGVRFLQITDRKKELMKTSGGKYVAPAPIESKLKEEFLIEQVMVLGDNRKFVSALILPAETALKDWCTHKEIPWTTMPEMLTLPQVVDKFQRIINDLNPRFGKVEQIKRFRLLSDVWEPVKADGSVSELTPTLKIKRRVIMEKYAPLIEEIYHETP